MPHAQTDNLNIAAFDRMPSPTRSPPPPLSDTAAKVVLEAAKPSRPSSTTRTRVFVVVGPCSIHDPVAGLDYARRLKKLADEVSDTLVLVMRVISRSPAPPPAGRATSTTRTWTTPSASTKAWRRPAASCST
jgi:3-deoxy-7-phosphoheptulonate synthase